MPDILHAMVEHHIQRQILRLIGTHDKARFTDIRPEGLENNAFQYHLKQLIATKLIAKNTDGTYALTSKGTGEFITSHLGNEENVMQAHDIFLLAIKDGDKRLLATRKVQPQLGLTGFLHGEPSWEKPLLQSAQERLLAKAGLSADLEVVGSGYITITKDGAYSSFVHATLITGKNVQGSFQPDLSFNTLVWYAPEELDNLDLIPSMSDLIAVLDGNASPFFDLRYEL